MAYADSHENITFNLILNYYLICVLKARYKIQKVCPDYMLWIPPAGIEETLEENCHGLLLIFR